MNRYPGDLGTDVYGIQLNEMRIGHFRVSAAGGVASDVDGVHAAIASKATAQTVTTGMLPIPYPRNITITLAGTTGDIAAGDIVVHGTNINDDPISETFTLTANQTDAEVGVKAFKTVNKIVIAAQDDVNATFTFGFGELLGLPVMLANKPVAFTLDDGVIMTAATFNVDDNEIEKNVIDVNGSLNGSVYDIFLVI